MRQIVNLFINRERVVTEIETAMLLVDFLRREVYLTGTKEACGIGVCGLCTVLLDGKAVSSCLIPAVFANGKHVVTVEGLTDEHAPQSGDTSSCMQLARVVQDAFDECEGFQCGICTPGQVVSAVSLLKENSTPDEQEIKHYMSGNLCRCTGYKSILSAIQLAAEKWREALGIV